jgi:hypothetical protein
MYTFYNVINADQKHTGMTNEVDAKMLKLWKEKWTEAGFDVRILNLNDAKHHSRFLNLMKTYKKFMWMV